MDGDSNATKGVRRHAAQTPLGVMNCPSCRPPVLFAWVTCWQVNVAQVDQCGRSDYAANSGDWWDTGTNTGGPPLAFGRHAKLVAILGRLYSALTGINTIHAVVKLSDITDGTSNTYLVGEKYMNPDSYFTGTDGADDSTMFQGWDIDIDRWTEISDGPPRQHQAGSMQRPHFRQRPRQRLQYGLLRRLGADDELHDRPGDSPPAGQPQGRPGDRRQETLAAGKHAPAPASLAGPPSAADTAAGRSSACLGGPVTVVFVAVVRNYFGRKRLSGPQGGPHHDRPKTLPGARPRRPALAGHLSSSPPNSRR